MKGYVWAISSTDGHVTTHKMLDFVNKRTGKEVVYKPTFGMMLTTLSMFLLVTVVGVLMYTKLKFFWMKWQVWFIGVIVLPFSFSSSTSLVCRVSSTISFMTYHSSVETTKATPLFSLALYPMFNAESISEWC